jgi:hypothetical protein
MKKLLLTLVAAGFAVSSFARGGGMMEQGSILLYGVGSYSSNNGSSTTKFGTANSNTSDNPRMRMWQVAPGIGFNITNNLAIGVDGFWGGTRMTYDRKTLGSFPSDDQRKTYDWGVGPFVRYTQPLSQYFFAFGQATAHYLDGRETYRTVTALTGGNSYVRDNDYRGFDVSFVPAVGAMLSRSWGLTFSVGGVSYQHLEYEYSTQGLPAGSNMESKDNQFNITFGQQFNLGIQKYIGMGRRVRGNAEPMDDTRRIDTTDEESDDNNRRRRNRRNDDE